MVCRSDSRDERAPSPIVVDVGAFARFQRDQPAGLELYEPSCTTGLPPMRTASSRSDGGPSYADLTGDDELLEADTKAPRDFARKGPEIQSHEPPPGCWYYHQPIYHPCLKSRSDIYTSACSSAKRTRKRMEDISRAGPRRHQVSRPVSPYGKFGDSVRLLDESGDTVVQRVRENGLFDKTGRKQYPDFGIERAFSYTSRPDIEAWTDRVSQPRNCRVRVEQFHRLGRAFRGSPRIPAARAFRSYAENRLFVVHQEYPSFSDDRFVRFGNRMIGGLFLFQKRKIYRENRAFARGARDIYKTVVLLDDRVRHREPQTGAFLFPFGRKEGIEDLTPDLNLDTHARVLDGQPDIYGPGAQARYREMKSSVGRARKAVTVRVPPSLSPVGA